MVRPTSHALIANLREPIDIRNFQNPMTLRDFVGILYDLFRAKDKELPIVVDSMAFKWNKDENFGFLVSSSVKFTIPRSNFLLIRNQLARRRLSNWH